MAEPSKIRYNVTTKLIEEWNATNKKWVVAPAKGQFAPVRFEPLATEALRVIVRDKEGIEWSIPTNFYGDDPTNYPDKQRITIEKPTEVKGYTTQAQADAQAEPDEISYQLPDGSWWLKSKYETPGKKGYTTQAEAEVWADPDEVVYQLPDGSFWTKPAYKPPTLKGYASREEAEDAASGDEMTVQAPDGSWINKPRYDAPPLEGYLTETDVDTAIAGRPDYEKYQKPDKSWAIRLKYEAPEPKGYTTVAEAQGAARQDQEVYPLPTVAGQPPRYGLREKYTKPKVTRDDILIEAVLSGDVDKVRQIQDLLNMPTSAERLEMALKYANSPKDYDLVIGIARGEIPVSQFAGGPRAAVETQKALDIILKQKGMGGVKPTGVTGAVADLSPEEVWRQAARAGLLSPDQLAQGAKAYEAQRTGGAPPTMQPPPPGSQGLLPGQPGYQQFPTGYGQPAGGLITGQTPRIVAQGIPSTPGTVAMPPPGSQGLLPGQPGYQQFPTGGGQPPGGLLTGQGAQTTEWEAEVKRWRETGLPPTRLPKPSKGREWRPGKQPGTWVSTAPGEPDYATVHTYRAPGDLTYPTFEETPFYKNVYKPTFEQGRAPQQAKVSMAEMTGLHMPTMGTLGQLSVPEQESYWGQLALKGISGPLATEFERQMTRLTPGTTKRRRVGYEGWGIA